MAGIKPNKEHNGPVIFLEKVKKSFGDKKVLNGIDLEIEKGENLVVLGRSGSGKSVLIKCISGLINPDSGKIIVLGESITDMNHSELNKIRKKIGFLFQSGALYDSLTVRENLEFPLRRNLSEVKEPINDLVEEVLENVGLKEAIDKMPSELSGGMKKRIALARTLIMKPEIILYDEPTTGLDSITSREISELMLEMQKKYKTSSMIITHDLACAEITANRIVVLNEGVFIEEGSYKDLKNSKNKKVSTFFV
jgi:phospholipid/cholesterol/gamma-HCH transport system ATP-binding protein